MISYRVGVKALYLCTSMNESLSLLMQISSSGNAVHSGFTFYIMGVQNLISVCIKKKSYNVSFKENSLNKSEEHNLVIKWQIKQKFQMKPLKVKS